MKAIFISENCANELYNTDFGMYKIVISAFSEGAKAAIILPYTQKADVACTDTFSLSQISLPKGVFVGVRDGWDGSYHEAHYDCGAGILVYVKSKRAGFLGRLRRAAKLIQAYIESYDDKTALEYKQAYILGSMQHKGIVSQEGD